MTTKTTRILSYLPDTFKVSGPRSPLKTVVNTFGTELLHAENSLAALMRAHWVDHADLGADKIDDLARMAALYGLSPRPEQTVEEFRTHLKQYVKTALQGTVTVQGILRTSANNLGLQIADIYEQIDTWWTRQTDTNVTEQHCGNDAATALFGKNSLHTSGQSATAAAIVGQVELVTPLDLTDGGIFSTRILSIKINGKAKVVVDLLAAAANQSAVTAIEIVDAINQTFGAQLASVKNNKLVLTALTTGPGSSILLEEPPNDAALAILGFTAHSAKGQAAMAASYVSKVDLSGQNDLSKTRYLRLNLDASTLAEIDCAGPVPEATTLPQICHAINSAFGKPIASHDEQFLTLTSPITGAMSSITFLSSAAQDAGITLLGQTPSAVIGHDKLAATLVGSKDLSKGVDLTTQFLLRIRVNNSNAVNVDCRGLVPELSQLPEITSKINDTLGKKVASHNGKNLILSSTTFGVGSKLTVEDPNQNNDEKNNAAQILLGIVKRSAKGRTARPATLVSPVDLSAGINLYATNRLRVALDNNSPVDINLLDYLDDPKNVSLQDITQIINQGVGSNIASHDGKFLTLLSPIKGSISQLKVLPFTQSNSARFVSQTPVQGEASDSIFGFSSGSAKGQDATPAQTIGLVNLSGGVDLRSAQYLTIKINQQPAVTINCAGPRPRATLLAEVINNINTGLGIAVARQDEGKLALIAPTLSQESIEPSTIEFLPPNVNDASALLLGTKKGLVRGTDALGVTFVGTQDLSATVDLSTNANLRLNIDDLGPIEISCAGLVPSSTTLAQITIAINVAFGKNVANHDGRHLILSSNKTGHESFIEILTADSDDATETILGITSPRIYSGKIATAATIIGDINLSAVPLDLSTKRFLEIELDGNALPTIDCAANAADISQVSLAEIIDAINTSVGLNIASEQTGHLVLTSPGDGLSSRIQILTHTGSDARKLLFGEIGDTFTGTEATSAILESHIDLATGTDLSVRNQVRLSIDHQPPISININAGKQDQVFIEEIINAINSHIPQLASRTPEGKLRLTSPSKGSLSHIELLPLRFIKLQEYLPAKSKEQTEFHVEHGKLLTINNSGKAEVSSKLIIQAKNGVFGAGLLSEQINWYIRLFSIVQPNETVTFIPHIYYGIEAQITAPNGATRSVRGKQLELGPLLPHMTVPTKNIWRLRKGLDGVRGVVLNNPLSANLLIVKSRLALDAEAHIDIQVTSTNLKNSPQPFAVEKLSGQQVQMIGTVTTNSDSLQYQLLDEDGGLLANLIPARQIALADFANRAVLVTGQLLGAQGVLEQQLIASSIACLFDVSISSQAQGQADMVEYYPATTIGNDPKGQYALQQKLLFNDPPSSIVSAVSRQKQHILSLPKGQSKWRYIECHNSRFDQTRFNSHSQYEGRFTGGFNVEMGLAGISHYDQQPPAQVSALYAQVTPKSLHKTKVIFDYASHQPGTMQVILPADLPARFGGRFNQALFSVPTDKPETHLNVVTEPQTDTQYLGTIVNKDSNLIVAKPVSQVPLGFTAQFIPLSKAISFTGGTRNEPARVFLAETDVPGFIELSAKAPGAWGNQLSILVCDSGPAIFDLLIHFPGSRFENARNAVLGDEVTGVVNESLRPGAMGVRQAKAAGVRVEVIRENCETTIRNSGEQDV